jgi:hypothetical protein
VTRIISGFLGSFPPNKLSIPRGKKIKSKMDSESSQDIWFLSWNLAFRGQFLAIALPARYITVLNISGFLTCLMNPQCEDECKGNLELGELPAQSRGSIATSNLPIYLTFHNFSTSTGAVEILRRASLINICTVFYFQMPEQETLYMCRKCKIQRKVIYNT